jgi:hypothetical protein
MAWNGTKDWSNEPLIATDMDTYVSDNLDALKEPPSAVYDMDELTDLTVSSTTFVDLDAVEGRLQHTITTTGGDVMVGFRCAMSGAAATALFLDITVDGTPEGGTDGIFTQSSNASANVADEGIFFMHIITGLAAGSHVFKLQGKVDASGSVIIYRGAGTAQADVIGQFWVREMS